MAATLLKFQSAGNNPTGYEASDSVFAQATNARVKPAQELPVARDFSDPVLDDVRQVYGSPSHKLTKMIELAQTASTFCGDALELIDTSVMQADLKMQYVQSCVYEMLPFRDLEEGTALLTVSLAAAFINNEAKPLNRKQILLINQALKGIFTSPFMSIDKAVDFTIAFEDSDLSLESDGLNLIFQDALESGFVAGE